VFCDVSMNPYEFGPSSAMFASSAIWIILCSSSVCPASENPAERITADLTFLFWACLRTRGTAFEGTAMTTQSILWGISRRSW